MDLSKIGVLKAALLESFTNQSEEVKSAASYALGNVALGNLQVTSCTELCSVIYCTFYLPF